MKPIKTLDEFINDEEYRLLLEEIEKGDFTRFNELEPTVQGDIMSTWDKDKIIQYLSQDSISEEECFDAVLKVIRGEDICE